MTAPLITLAQAKEALKIEDEAEDSALLLRIEEATAIVRTHVKARWADWTDRSLPADVRAALLLVLRGLHDRPDMDPVSDTVKALLAAWRDPTLA